MTPASLRVEEQDGVNVAYVAGEIDIVNAGEVGGQLFAAAPNTAEGLVVDLSGVTYLDSRGLHLLMELAERLRVRDQRLHVVVPPRALIKRVLLLTHIDAVIPLFSSVDDAVARFKSEQ